MLSVCDCLHYVCTCVYMQVFLKIKFVHIITYVHLYSVLCYRLLFHIYEMQ